MKYDVLKLVKRFTYVILLSCACYLAKRYLYNHLFRASTAMVAGLSIVVGKKGSGKTAFALSIIARELKYGKRKIITNMEIYKDKLEQFLREQGFECDVANRLIVLGAKDQRFARWWRIRGDSVDDVYGAFGIDARWDKCVGILFVVDEGQHHYPARGWTSRQRKVHDSEPPLGEECNDYLCQERKTGDDTVVTTPSSSLLDKDFRTLSTECVVLDNWYRKRMRGIKATGRFQVNIYENCPPQQGEEPADQPHFYLDKTGLMACYNTAAGAGFIGSVADTQKELPPGMHWGWLVVGWCGLSVVLWLVAHFSLTGVLNHMKKGIAKHEGLGLVPALAVAQTNSKAAVFFPSTNGAPNLERPAKRAFDADAEEIVAIAKGTAGYGITWKEGYTTLAVSVAKGPKNDYFVDGVLCKLVSAGRTNAPIYHPGGVELLHRRNKASDDEDQVDDLLSRRGLPSGRTNNKQWQTMKTNQ